MEEKKNFFAKITANPLALVALAYPYMLVLLIIFGLYYIHNVNAVVQNKLPVKQADSAAVVTELAVKEASVSSAVDLALLVTPSAEMVDRGKTVYANNCASCHGADGKGDGVAGAALNPKPRNFHAADGWKNGRKIAELFKTLQLGISGSGMAAYDFMPVADRVAVISFLRASFMQAPPMDSNDEIAALDRTYSLSKGTVQPGQVPVAVAAGFISAEQAAASAKINSALQAITNAAPQNAGAALFLSVTADPRRALVLLSNNNTWASDARQFAQLVKHSPGQNGFKGTVVALSAAELAALHGYLKTVML